MGTCICTCCSTWCSKRCSTWVHVHGVIVMSVDGYRVQGYMCMGVKSSSCNSFNRAGQFR